jgi:hypothetical protein
MSDERDEATGQFVAEPEQLFGLAGVERDQGYTPLAGNTPAESNELTVEEAAAAIAQMDGTPEYLVRSYADGVGEDEYGVTQPSKETVTLEQAAKDLGDLHNKEAAELEAEEAAKIRDEVDALRGVEAKPEPETELDIEKALNNPRIKAAVEQQFNEAESVRQTFSNAVDTANDFARASFIQNFPEIAALPLEQWKGALAQMAQQQPARFQQAVGTLQRVVELQTAQQHQQQQRESAERLQFETYSRAESARFDDMIKSESKESRRAIEDSILESIKEYGGDTAEFVELFKNTKLLNSAVAQRMLWDAGKYRQMQKAAKAMPTRAVPPVQRPGVASRTSGYDGDIQALDRQLSATGSLKVAAKLLEAKSRSRARG